MATSRLLLHPANLNAGVHHDRNYYNYFCRRLFNWFAFILFFYNGIAGLVGAILRAFMSSFFGLLLLFRLDRIVLMKGFEAFDFGETVTSGLNY